MISIIVVSDSSLPSWIYILTVFLCDKKILSIQIYLPTPHYINFLAFQGAHKSHVILFNIKHVKGIYLFFTIFKAQILCCSMVLNHSSNLFINFWIHIQHIHLRFLRGWLAIFIWVICKYLIFWGVCCHHSKFGGAYNFVRSFVYPIKSDSGSMSS